MISDGRPERDVAFLSFEGEVSADYWPLLRTPGCEQGRVAVAQQSGNSLTLQMFADSAKQARSYCIQLGRASRVPPLRRGDQIAFATRGGTITSFSLVNRSESPLPEQADWMAPARKNERRRFRELDVLLNKDARRLLQVRNGILFGVRSALQREGFVEVELPILRRHADIAPASQFEISNAADGQPLYLRTTFPPFERFLLSVDRAYTIGPNFRNGDLSSKNLPEFSMLCAAMKSASYLELNRLLRTIVADVVESVVGTCVVHFRGHSIDLRCWQELDLEDTFSQLFGISLKDIDSDDAMTEFARTHNVEAQSVGASIRHGHLFRAALFDRIFESLIVPRHNQPTFYTEVPWYLAGPAERHPSKSGLKLRGEGYVGGIELTNAKNVLTDFSAITEWHESVAKEKAAAGFGERATVDTDYLRSVSYGLQPGALTSIGLDRLIMLALCVDDIQDAVVYPMP